VPRADILAFLEAVLRVYNEAGRRDNLWKARIKILVNVLGPEEMRARVAREFEEIKRRGVLTLPADEVARIAAGSGMRVLAWIRSPKTAPGVSFVGLDTLLAESDVVSLHLLLTDETRGFLGADRIAKLRPGVILVNTARGALVDEAAMLAALREGRIGHAALDVFHNEPLKADHPLAGMANVTLSAHAAFRTPEASMTLLRRAIDIVSGIVLAGTGSGLEA